MNSSSNSNFLLFRMIFMVNLTKESADKISPYATEVTAVWMKTKFQRCCSRRSNLKKTITHYL